MSTKAHTANLVALAAALVAAAADLHSCSAIRPEHDSRFSSLRTQLGQLQDAANEADAAAQADIPEAPGALEFEDLKASVDGLAATVSDLAGIVAKLTPAA